MKYRDSNSDIILDVLWITGQYASAYYLFSLHLPIMKPYLRSTDLNIRSLKRNDIWSTILITVKGLIYGGMSTCGSPIPSDFCGNQVEILVWKILIPFLGENFILVLPPWGPMVHWREELMRLKWAGFFDIPSLNHFVPVMEFDDFFNEAFRSEGSLFNLDQTLGVF